VSTEIDHLVVAAATLADGVRWCEAALGVTPAPGGSHPLMGTRNRLLQLSAPAFPRCYLEIVAVDPEAPPPGRARWFGLDDAALQAALRADGPRLIHAVARSTMLDMHRWGLVNQGFNPGATLRAHRDTPAGRLAWQICVRDDGRLEAGGLLPTLIQWDGPHPAEALPDQGVRLRSLQIDGLPATACDVLRLRGVAVAPEAAPGLRAVLDTPQGAAVLVA